MNKQEFIDELRRQLAGKIDPADIQDIVMDYEEIFAASGGNYKTEDEIAQEIGTPSQIAKNILEDYPSPPTLTLSKDAPHQTAPLGKRLIAFLIDCVLSILPIAIFPSTRVILPVMLFAPINPALPLSYAAYTAYAPSDTEIAINWLLLLIFWLYGTVVMLILRDKTIGMLLMGIRIQKSDRQRHITAGDVIIRQFLGFIVIPVLTFGFSHIVSFFWALFSQANHTVHDKIAGTIVVEDSSRKPVI